MLRVQKRDCNLSMAEDGGKEVEIDKRNRAGEIRQERSVQERSDRER
jgi:hypothetical protein